MGTWARAEAAGVVFALWIVVRLATRRPVAHPWFVAFAVAGAGAAVGDGATLLHGPLHTFARFVTGFAAFAAVVIFVEGLRRESGAAPVRFATAAGAFAGCALAGAALMEVPQPRAALLGDVLISAVLLNAVVPLLRATRRRIGSWTLVAGIAVYALGRTAMVIAQVTGHDVRAVGNVADVVSILSFGLGLTVFGLEGLREKRRAQAAVGHRPTTA